MGYVMSDLGLPESKRRAKRWVAGFVVGFIVAGVLWALL